MLPAAGGGGKAAPPNADRQAAAEQGGGGGWRGGGGRLCGQVGRGWAGWSRGAPDLGIFPLSRSSFLWGWTAATPGAGDSLDTWAVLQSSPGQQRAGGRGLGNKLVSVWVGSCHPRGAVHVARAPPRYNPHAPSHPVLAPVCCAPLRKQATRVGRVFLERVALVARLHGAAALHPPASSGRLGGPQAERGARAARA